MCVSVIHARVPRTYALCTCLCHVRAARAVERKATIVTCLMASSCARPNTTQNANKENVPRTVRRDVKKSATGRAT